MSDTATDPTTPAESSSPPLTADRAGSPLGHARAFVGWIDQRCHADPGVRSALRRGVGRPLDDVPFMHRYVVNWLTADHLRSPDIQRAYYTVASLIANQRRDQYAAAKQKPPVGEADTPSNEQESSTATPQRRYGTSLGTAFAAAVDKGTDGIRESSAETRLNLLTRQSVNGLHRHLPGAVRQLRDKNVEVDWAQLLVDLTRWHRHSGSIKRRWLQDYYRARNAAENEHARRQDDANPPAPPAPAAEDTAEN
ncbi:CRISPR system Cascade subunit CasB [Kitasatospora sp. GAS204A]|uniref:type I-E CRISPR-associated protein Cse2/CasB n=1 Tax=unclassified Kitasatospora TaxID=2633591 RepID=UPI00247350FE|nr:type I-E CRISPR-associated protein Cse2/CasB [Kitasatospora sp. GAS204B]MDH6120954.1 CRISPR system Cascade subunit CasB [Kitasatospora sp. GAS204B]